jgi:hypothetical protein
MTAKTWAKTKIFANTFAKTKYFSDIFRENKNFSRKPSGTKIFRENSRENLCEIKNFCETQFCEKRANLRIFLLEKRGFRFNPKLTLFMNMLKLHKITISESRDAEP